MRERPGIRLPFVARPGRIWAFAISALVLITAAFFAGSFVQSPQSSALDAAEQTIPVFAAAEMRQIAEGTTLQAQVTAGTLVVVSGVPISQSARAVVTQSAVGVGAELDNRQLIGQVSNRPLFALNLAIPLYRDLHRTDKGPDVASLQAALGIKETGEFDATTARAFRSVYTAAGLLPPGETLAGTFVRMDEVLAIAPTGPRPTIAAIASVGVVLDEEVPFLTLQTGPSEVQFRALTRDVDQLAVGTQVAIRGADSAEAPGVVRSVGTFRPAESAADGGETTTAGYDISVDFVDKPAEGFAVGESVLVVTGESDPAASLSVPLLAVRQDSSGSYVLKKGDGNQTTNVAVTVVAERDGWVAVVAEALGDGDEVQVAP